MCGHSVNTELSGVWPGKTHGRERGEGICTLKTVRPLRKLICGEVIRKGNKYFSTLFMLTWSQNEPT